jgi:hypothetical protein
LAGEEGPEVSRTVFPREGPREGPQPQERQRREERSDVQLAVTVYGFATTGKLFVEHCSTRNVSHSGCCLRLQTRPQADSALALRLLRWGISAKRASQLLYQTVWLRQDGDGWVVGASSLGPADLYCLAFPETR